MSAIVYACFVAIVLHGTLVSSQRYDGQYWPCNPTQNASCAPNPGLNQYDYFMDFTNPPSDLSEDWTTSNYATINYNTKAKNGAEFTFAKRYDAPQLFSNFYILFGRVDVVMQVAPGTGMISSAVLMSDDFDEIDWEMSGNDFNLAKQYPTGVVQNNYFSRGITGNYDRGQFQVCTKPQTQFHTYSFDWSPNKLDWLIDGQVVRTFLAANSDNYAYGFPQTPAKIQLGIWSGGDVDQNQGTRDWAGGYTNLNTVPYTMYVKSVRIRNYNPAKHYKWTDQSGSWKSIRLINDTVTSSSSTSSKISSTLISSVLGTSTLSSLSSLNTPKTSVASISSAQVTSNTQLIKSTQAIMTASTASTISAISATNTQSKATAQAATTSTPSSTVRCGSVGSKPAGNATPSVASAASGTPTTSLSLRLTSGSSPQSTLTIKPTATGSSSSGALNSAPSTAAATTAASASNVAQHEEVGASTLKTSTVSSAKSSSTTTTSSKSSPTPNMTTLALWPFGRSMNGQCAYWSFAICKDSGYGDCCSRWGVCGNSAAHCGTDCLAHWGSCWALPTKEKRDESRWDRRDRAYPPGKRPAATDVV